MSDIPFLQIGENIVVPLQTELHDSAARRLQEDILSRIDRGNNVKGLIIDISAVDIVDSFLGRLIGETAKMSRLMGVETVLVGMKKEVVITLLQLGLEIKNINTALTIEDAVERLKKIHNDGIFDKT